MIREVKITSFYTIAGMAIGVLQGIIVARYWGAEGKGIIASFLALVNIIFPLASNGGRQFVAVQLKEQNLNRADLLTIALGIYLIGNVILMFSSIALAIEHTLVLSTLFGVVAFSHLGSGVALAVDKPHFYNINKTVPVLLNFLGVIGLIIAQQTAQAYLYFYLVSASAVSICYVVFAAQFLPSGAVNMKHSLLWLQTGWKYALPLFLLTVNFRIDILFLKNMLGEAIVGLYSTALSFSELLLLFPNIIGVVVFSKSASAKTQNLTHRTWRLAKYSLVIGPIGLVLLWFVLPTIIPLLYGEPFIPSVGIAQTLAVATYFLMPFTIINAQLIASKKTAPSTIILVLTSIVNIATNYLMIPIFGVYGAVYASVMSYSIAGFAILIYYRKYIL